MLHWKNKDYRLKNVAVKWRSTLAKSELKFKNLRITSISHCTMGSSHTKARVFLCAAMPYVVKFGEPQWEKWLAWGENMHHSKHSSKFWLRGYLWFSFKGPLKLLNKRPRPKHELCNNSVIFRLIWMIFGMQLSYGPPFPLAKIQQGHEGQRPEGHKVKGQNFKKLAEAILAVI